MKTLRFSITDSLYFLSFFILLIACAKEYSNEGGNSARYTLYGDGSDCTGAVVAGNYYTDTALNAGNNVQVQAHVTKKGSYSLTTNTVNGIQFSASGSFADTGNQVILLKGNGKPQAAGAFTLTAQSGNGCTFAVNVKEAQAGYVPDCNSIILNGTYVVGTALTIANSIELTINVTVPGAYSITTDTLDGFSFSGSGKFTASGAQKVTLKGLGTPGAARNLSFTIKAGSNNCTANVTVTDAAPLAVYVIESGQNTCIYTLSGNYTAGVPTTSANTVKINVFVTEKGNFTIATSTIDGVTFSYSGTYTTTGAQTVTLVASGTPTNKGLFTFTPKIVGPHPLGGEGCSFDLTVQ